MFSFNLIRWLKSWSRSRVKTYVKKPRVRLALEELESRLAPTVYTWTGGGGAANDNWSNITNWQSGIVPTAAAPVDLVFNNAATFFTANNDINGLVVNSLTISSGTYTLTGNQFTLGNPNTNSGTISVNNGAAGETMSNAIRLGGGVPSTEFVTVQAAGSLTLSGNLTDVSATQLTKQGGGLLTLSGINAPVAANNFTGIFGPFLISNATGNGTVAITNADALGSATTSNLQSITLSGASAGRTQFSVKYSANGVTFASTVGVAYTGILANDAAALQTALNTLLSSQVPAGASATVFGDSSSAGTETFSVSFGGSLAGLSVHPLQAAVTAGTPGTISVSTLIGGGTPNPTTVQQNTQLQISYSSATPLLNPLVVSGAGPDGISGAIATTPGVGGSANLAGAITMNANTTIGVANMGYTLTVNGVISDSNVSGFNLTKEGAGTLYLDPIVPTPTAQDPNQGNTYHGNTTVNGGVLDIGHPYALGAGGGTTTVNTANAESGTLGLEFDPLTNTVGHTQIAAANLVFAEVQTVTLTGATVGTTQFTLSYNGVSTAPITYSALDAPTVQADLNALSTIGGIGASVAVVQIGSTFNITFGGSLGGMEIPTLNAAVTTGAGAAINVGQQQTFTLNGAVAGTTKFTMTFNGATTAPITFTAADAPLVQGALNTLATIGGIGGTTAVTQNGSTFIVTFGGSLSGPGIPTLNATVTTAPGSVVLGQVQTVNLTGAIAGSTEFTLSFNGVSTGPILYTTTDGPAVQAALNALSSINGPGGSVNVTQTGSTFTITFGGSLAGPNTPELNASIFTSVAVGTTNGTVPIGFKVPNEFLTLNGFGKNGVNVAPRGPANSKTGGPVPGNTAVITAAAEAGTTVTITAVNGFAAGQTVVIEGIVPAGYDGTFTITSATPASFTYTAAAGLGFATLAGATATVPAEFTGAFSNQVGDNAWERNITLWSSLNELTNSNHSAYYEPAVTIGAVQGTNLTIDGVLGDNGISASANYSLSKVGLGRVILTAANTFTADVDVLQGGLNLRDSNALGMGTNRGKTAWWGTSIELQADGIPDSSGAAGTYNLFFPGGTFDLNGPGWNDEGALANISGQNVIEGNVQLQTTVGTTKIGVSPNPDPTNIQAQTWNDISQLTINGQITGVGASPNAAALTKVGYGELVLTGDNTFLAPGPYQQNAEYNTAIAQGWITAENQNALGGSVALLNPVDEPGVMVLSGAALVLKQDLLGNNLNLAYNLNLNGTGMQLTGPALTLTPWLNLEGALENLDGNNTATGSIFLNGQAGIGVELDGANRPANPSQLVLTGEILDGVPSGGAPGELVKIGSQRLIAQGPGTYSGGVDIQGGALRIQNDTALGEPANYTTTSPGTTTTTVESGASLELAPTVPELNGGITRGLQIWYDHLVLNGTGSSTFGDSPLTVLSQDNVWRGGITLNSTVAITLQGVLGNTAVPTMVANTINPVTGASTLAGTAPTLTVATTTSGSPGINAVQTLVEGGVISGGTFTLTVSNGATSATTSPISWSTQAPVLLANIQMALNALAPTFGGTVAAGIASVALNSPVVDVSPNSRLTVVGSVDDGPVTSSPSSLFVSGGGELALTGNNTYRGLTLVKQGILTVGNDGALGSTITAQIQMITFGSVSSSPLNQTSFTLSFNGFTTPVIPYTGIPLGVNGDVLAVQNALNALSSIGGVGGSVTVVANSADTAFTITFGGALSGFVQPLITTTITAGTPGGAVGTITNFGTGGVMVATTGQVQLENGVAISGKPIEMQGQGNPAEPEVQNVVVGGGAGTFSLSFTNPVTGVPSTTGALPFGATATMVQAALNQLAAITGGNGDGTNQGSVSVIEAAENVYTVSFTGTFAGTPQPPLSVATTGATTAFDAEVIRGGSAIATPDQWFSTGPGPVNNAEEYNGGANLTTSLTTATGPVTSIVTDPNDPNIIYIATAGGGAWKTINNGQSWTPLFDGVSTVQQVVVQGVTGETFQLTFLNPLTGTQSTTVVLPYNASAEQIQAALNAVLGGGNTAQVSQVLTSAAVDEVQQLTFTGAVAGATQFTLDFNGAGTNALTYQGPSAGNADALALQNALNSLSTIGGLAPTPGSVVVTANALDTVFTVSFGGSMFDQPQTLIGSSLPPATLAIVELTHGAPSVITNTITFSGGLTNTSVPALSTTSPFVTVNVTQQGVGAAAAMFTGAIAMDPTNPNILYLGTGTSQGENPQDSYYGTGVYRTTDGGQTWNIVEDAAGTLGPQNPLAGLAVNKIVVDPKDPSVIYVATTDANTNAIPGPGVQDQPIQSQAGIWRFGIVNEVQQITITTPVVGGSFSLLFKNLGNVTAQIPYTGVATTDAGAIMSALNALPAIGGVGGRVTVTASNVADTTFIVSFGGSQYSLTEPLMTPFISLGGIAVTTADVSNPLFNIGANSWLNLTNITSIARTIGVSPTGNADPGTPGPDDNFLLGFPQNEVDWTDLAISPTTGVLYAAMGNPTLNLFESDDGVYELTDPLSANNTNNPPNWYVGSYAGGGGGGGGGPASPLIPDNEAAGEFPTSNTQGNIKISLIPAGTPVSNPGPTDLTFANTASGNFNAYVRNGELTSVNNGQTWAAAPALGAYLASQGNYAMATAFDSTNGTLYAGGTDDSGHAFVEMLPLAGAWSAITPDITVNAPVTGVLSMTVASNHDLIVGTEGGIFEWSPVTKVWTALNGDLAISEINGLATDPTNASITYAAGAGIGTVQSTGNDNGTQIDGAENPTFTNEGNLFGGDVQVDPNNANIVYHVQEGSHSGAAFPTNAELYVSTNGAAGPWTPIYNSNFGQQFFPLVVDSHSRVFVGGATIEESTAPASPTFANLDPQNAFTGVGSIAVADLQGPFQPDASFTDVTDLGANNPDPNTVYVTSGNTVQTLDTSTTGTFTLTLQAANGFQVSTPFPLSPASGAAGIQASLNFALFVFGGSVNVTQVGATTYTVEFVGALAGKNEPQMLVRDIGTSTASVSMTTQADSNIWVTKDFGTTWVERSLPVALTQGAYISDLEVDPTNRDTVYAVVNGQYTGADTGAVWKSTDAGQNWTFIGQGLPTGIPAWQLAIDPRTGNLYLGSDQGVFELPDGAQSWQALNTGLPNVAVHTLDLNQTTNILTIGTYGRGEFQYFLDDSVANTGALRAGSGSDTWNGPIILTGAATISANGNLSLQNNIAISQLTILGSISDLTLAETTSGANTLTKVGQGNVVLAGADTYGGKTIVQEGTLAVHNPAALGTTTQGTFVDPGAVLQLATSLTNEAITLAGDGIEISGHFSGALENASGDNVYNGVITLQSNATIGVDPGGSLTLASPGTITDQGQNFSLTKEGQGSLILTTANNYGGGTKIDQGILNIQNQGALGVPGATTTVGDGAQLQLQAPTGTNLNIGNENLNITGTGIGGSGALLNVNGTNTWGNSGNTIMLSETPNFAPSTSPAGVVGFNVANLADTLTLNAPIGETIPTGIAKLGAGTLALTQSDSYSGTTFIHGGFVNVQNSNALGANVGDEVQRITAFDPLAVANPASADSFTLTFNGQTTAPLVFNTTNANTVATALNLLSSIGLGGVNVTESTFFSGISEIQTLNLTGAQPNITAFTLSFNGNSTGAITYTGTAGGPNGDVAQIQSALNALPSIGPLAIPGFVTVTANATDTAYTISFGGGLADAPQPLIVPTITSTPGTGSANVSEHIRGSGSPANVFTVTFVGAGLAGNPQNLITATPSSPSTTVAVTEVAAGGIGTLVDPNTALILNGDLAGVGASIDIPSNDSVALNGVGAATLNVNGAITAGTFTITVGGQTTGAISANLPAAALASTLQSALAVLPNVGFGNVNVLANANNTFTIAFSNTVPNTGLVLTTTGLVGGTMSIGQNGALFNATGNNTLGGNIILESSSTINTAPNAQLAVNGIVHDPQQLTGSQPGDLTKIGTGTLIFAGANTYSGNTLINQGNLNIQNSSGLGLNTSEQQSITISGSSGTLAFGFVGFPAGVTTGAFSVAGLTGANLQTSLNTMLANINSPGGGAGTVTVTPTGPANSYTVTFGGSLANRFAPLLAVQSTTPFASGSVALVELGGESSTTVANGASLQLQSFGTPIIEDSLKPLFIVGNGTATSAALQNVSGNNVWGDTPVTLAGTSTIGANQPSQLAINQPVTDGFQTQTVTFAGVNPGDTFQLGFESFVTNTLVYSITPAVNAANIQAALASLPSIADHLGGTIAVTANLAGNVFTVTFGGTLAGANRPAITGTATSGVGVINAVTMMNTNDFGVNKGGGGDVIYGSATGNSYTGLTNVSGGTLELDTGALGVLGSLIVGDSQASNEIFSLNLNPVGVGNSFTLSVGANTTGPLTFLGNADDAANFRNALNAIIGSASATVLQTGAGTFIISFAGNNPSITASAPALVTTVAASTTGPVPNSKVVQLDVSNQIATGSTITINDDGELNLNGFAQASSAGGSITMVGGDILLPANSDLTLNGGTVTATSDAIGAALVQGAGNVTLGGALNTLFTVNQGVKPSDMVISSVINGPQGLTKLGSGRLELANLNTFGGVTSLGAGDVQVDGQGAVQTVTLFGAVPGSTRFILSANGINSGQITYNGTAAVDVPAIQNAVATILGIPAASVGVAADATDTIFTLTLPATETPITPTITSSAGTGTAGLTLPNNIGNVLMSGGSLSGTGSVGNIPAITGAAVTGTINPGVNSSIVTDTGVLLVNGALTLGPSSTLAVDVKNAATVNFQFLNPVAGVTTYTLTINGVTPAQLTYSGNSNVDVAAIQAAIAGVLNVNPALVAVTTDATDTVFTVTVLVPLLTITPTITSVAGTGTVFTFAGHTAPVPGVDYDQVQVNGNVNLGNALLTGTVNASNVNLGDTFTILQVTGNNSLANSQVSQMIGGVKTPISNNGSIFLNGAKFVINYNYGVNGSVVLTRAQDKVVSLSIASSVGQSSATAGTIQYGQDVSYTATIVPETNASVTPSSTVIFTVDAGSANAHSTPPILVTIHADGSATATFDPQTLFGVWGPTLGSPHTIDASFSDPTNGFLPASTQTPAPPNFNDTFIQTVNPATAAVTVASTPVVTSNSPLFGQAVTLTATVLPGQMPLVAGASNPTGNVTFLLDGTTPLTPPAGQSINGSGQFVLALPANVPVGPHTIQVSYLGDVNYNPSNTPTTFSLPIFKDQSVLAIVPSPASSALGQVATFNVQVSPSANPSTGTPNGVLNIYDATTSNPPLASALNYSGGTAVFNVSNLSLGSHNIIVTFTDSDGDYLNTISSVPYSVTPATTQTVFVAPTIGSSSAFGQSVTFIANVSANPTVNPSFGTPTGNIAIWDKAVGVGAGGILLGTGGVNGSGNATIASSALAQGVHTLFAVFTPIANSNFGTSTGTLTPFSVNGVGTTTTVTASPASGDVVGETVNLTATITATTGIPSAGSSVTFYDGTAGSGTFLGTGITNAAGKAIIANNTLAVGPHTITAVYTDTVDQNFGGSTGQLNNFQVSQALSKVVVTASQTSSTFGTPVSFTASISATAPGVATPANGDVVTFYDNSLANPIGTAPAFNGAATLPNFATLSAGSHTIIATFPGDTNLGAGTGQLNNFAVTNAPTVTNVSSSVTPPNATSFFGQPVTLTATVTAAGAGSPGAPTNGTVTFKLGAAVLGAGTFQSAGASFSIFTYITPATQLPVGADSITAVYAGVGNFGGSTSGAFTQQVNPANTAVALTSSSINNTSAAGQPVTFTATVTVQAPSSGSLLVNAGAVTFKDTTTNVVLGTVGVNANGVATFATSALPGGSNVITATFNDVAPNVNFASATSNTLNQNVLKASNLLVTPSPSTPTTFGTNVNLAVNVSGSGGIPSGTVTVTEGAQTLGAGTLIGGSVPGGITIVPTHAGTNTVVVTYGGDANFAPTSATISLTVNAAPTTTSLTSIPQPAEIGQTVTFTATVTAPAGSGAPAAGTVTFKNGTTTLGTSSTIGSSTANSSSFVFTTVFNTTGTFTISATYSGTTNYLTSSSTGSGNVTETVNSGPTLGALGLTQWTVNQAYSSSIPITGGTAPYVEQVTSGSLPTGLNASIVGSTVAIAGTPTVAGSFTFGVTVTDTAGTPKTGSFTIKINSAPTVGSPLSTTTATFGTAFTGTIPFTGGTGPFTLNTTGLPAGLTATVSGNTILIHGTPTATGTFSNIMISGTDAAGVPFSGGPFTITVNAVTTSTVLTSTPATWPINQPVTFTATVTAPNGSTPQGSVSFVIDGNPVTANLAGNIATTVVTFTTPGTHMVSANYTGSPNFQTSAAPPQTQNVRTSSSVALSSSGTTVLVGQPVTFTATVSGVGGAPTGSVTFYNGTTAIATVGLSSGVAVFTTSSLPAGTDTITAKYSGDSAFNPATSNAVTETVNAKKGRLV